MFILKESEPLNAVIRVVGVGGGGNNTVEHMLESQVEGVEFICVNTDAQALRGLAGAMALPIGSSLTKGLGAGADPEVGREAARQDRDGIVEKLAGTDLLFITAGLGGGTGTGAAPVIAEIARQLGILTVAVVTLPFALEGKRRFQVAEAGLEALARQVNSLIVIPNEKLLQVLDPGITLVRAFCEVNEILRSAVQGVVSLITRPGVINLDFNDICTVMQEVGMALIGTGSARGAPGAGRAGEATRQAIGSPLLEDIDLNGARGVLVNITANENLSLQEFQEVGLAVEQFVSDSATVIIGTSLDAAMDDEVRVTVIATGLTRNAQPAGPAAPLRTTGSPGGRKLSAEAGGQPRSLQGVARAPAVCRASAQTSPGELDIPAFLRRQND